ncbi:MAG TPA: WG repeat-containing protein, partial [Candidatus Rifleibacterium sp.]|nr:WG repeat-containing protein [Candidatus Rifleibacterium sp.]
STGVMLAQRDKTWELITAEAPQGTGMIFKDAGNISENLCWVMSDKGCGYLNGDGKMVIECQYEKAYLSTSKVKKCCLIYIQKCSTRKTAPGLSS